MCATDQGAADLDNRRRPRNESLYRELSTTDRSAFDTMTTVNDEIRALCQEMQCMARRVVASDLVLGPGGNISARWNDWMIITASGYSFETLTEEHFAGIDIVSGRQVFGHLKPSSETPTHLACYRNRPDIRFVLHTHPPYTTAVGTTLGEIPPMVAEFPVIVPRLPVLGYVTPTTTEMANAVVECLRDADCVVLGNHGMVAVGETLEDAYNRTLVTEESARIYVYSRIVGEPKPMTPEQIERLNAALSAREEVGGVATR